MADLPEPRRDVDWRRPVFSAGGRAYSRADILVAARLRGDWTRLEERTRAGLACVKRARGTMTPAVDLESAADEFRYAQNLITVEEVEEWLARCAVTFEEWRDYLERAWLTRFLAAELEVVLQRFPVADDEVQACIHAEAVCSGDLGRFAERLAARACLFDESSAAAAGPGEGMDERLARMEASFQSVLRDAITPGRLDAQLQAHRIEWIRVRWRGLAFTDVDAAREAICCVRQDGDTLHDVAARARRAVVAGDRLLEQVEPALRDALLSATPGDVVGPIALGDGFRVGIVDAKIAPSLEDPAVRRRAGEAVADALVADRMKQVRWHERL